MTNDNSMNLLSGLNAPQSAAVTHECGPLLIFAGAGSGKTRTLTHRIAYLVQERNVSPSCILAVTFTNKASREMQSRLDSLIGPASRRLWLGTFHAMCARMLRMHGEQIGLDPRFVIYDSDDTTRLAKEVLRDLDIDSDRYPAPRVLGRISDAKNNMRGPQQVAELASSPADRIYARLYAAYQQRLNNSRALDFDDLLLYGVKLVQESPAGQMFAERFQHVLIDEFQDANLAQFTWARELARVHKNIAVVGDDDQSIYAWRGADVRLILDFEKHYPDAQVIRLEQNYRSTQKILDAAHGVISKNMGRAPKQLWTDESGGAQLTLHGLANAQEEAFWVARKIQDLQREYGAKLSDFAILCRVNAQSRPFEEAFLRLRIPLKLIGTQRFYERREIKDLLAYLRVLFNPSDGFALLRIINTPPRGIGATTIQKVQTLAYEQGRTLYEVLNDEAALKTIGRAPAQKLGAFAAMLNELQKEAHNATSMADLIGRILMHTGFEDHLRHEKGRDSIDRVANIEELSSAAAAFDERMKTNESLDQEFVHEAAPYLGLFLETTSLDSEVNSAQNEVETVSFMTFHSAKGLEFPTVFLVGLEQGLLPHSRALWGASPDELEEERRLCYVGLTRARQRVFLTYAAQRTLHGRTETTQPSQFLEEIPAQLLERSGFASSRSVTPTRASTTWTPPPSRSATMANMMPKEPITPPKFSIGDRVKHPTFGEGLVVDASPPGERNEWVHVAFLNSDAGKKRLIVAYAPLEKIV